MHSHTRDQVFRGSTKRANFSVKDEADGEHLHSIPVVQGRYHDISATLDETASEAVAMSFIMDMMSFFRLLVGLQKPWFSFLRVVMD